MDLLYQNYEFFHKVSNNICIVISSFALQKGSVETLNTREFQTGTAFSFSSIFLQS